MNDERPGAIPASFVSAVNVVDGLRQRSHRPMRSTASSMSARVPAKEKRM